jgi:MFS family permease
MFISLIGSWVQVVALAWLVLTLTNSAFLLGVVGFLSTIPVVFLSLPSGVLVDRHDKKALLLATQTIQMVLAFFLAVLCFFNTIQVWQIMLISFQT